ncbi:hypothetical protein MTO96_038560 [Rhipicephalus appendiculatus]
MSSPLEQWRRTVHGFGSHLEMRTVEFVDKLEEWQYCSWCSVVSSEMSVLPCRHVMCQPCVDEYGENIWEGRNFLRAITCCGQQASSWTRLEGKHLGDKQVRCVNDGCDFAGCLRELDEHLKQSCAMYTSTCSKCEDTFAYKDIRNHYTACSGKMGIFLRTADARSLLDNFGAAFKNLEQAVASAKPDDRDSLRDTVDLVSEQFARIQGQLDEAVPSFVKASQFPRLAP